MSKECDITLKNLVLAGIGALATSADKSKELFHEFVKKGQSAVEQGKVANEELKRDLKEKVKDCVNVTIVKPSDKDAVLEALEELSPEDLAAVKARLEEMERSDDGTKDQKAE